jgi:hypothetical protein
LPSCACPRSRGDRGGWRFGKRPPLHHPLRLFGRLFLRGGIAETADQKPSSFGISILAHNVASARLHNLLTPWGALTLAPSAPGKGNHLGGLPLPSLQKGSHLPPLAAFPSHASQGLNERRSAVLERFDYWVSRLLVPLSVGYLLSPARGGRGHLSVDGQGGGRGWKGRLRTPLLRLRSLALACLVLGCLVLGPGPPLRSTFRSGLRPGRGRGNGSGGNPFFWGAPLRFLRRWRRGGLVLLRGGSSLRRRRRGPRLLLSSIPKLGHLRLDGLLEDPVTAHE